MYMYTHVHKHVHTYTHTQKNRVQNPTCFCLHRHMPGDSGAICRVSRELRRYENQLKILTKAMIVWIWEVFTPEYASQIQTLMAWVRILSCFDTAPAPLPARDLTQFWSARSAKTKTPINKIMFHDWIPKIAPVNINNHPLHCLLSEGCLGNWIMEHKFKMRLHVTLVPHLPGRAALFWSAANNSSWPLTAGFWPSSEAQRYRCFHDAKTLQNSPLQKSLHSPVNFNFHPL